MSYPSSVIPCFDDLTFAPEMPPRCSLIQNLHGFAPKKLRTKKQHSLQCDSTFAPSFAWVLLASVYSMLCVIYVMSTSWVESMTHFSSYRTRMIRVCFRLDFLVLSWGSRVAGGRSSPSERVSR